MANDSRKLRGRVWRYAPLVLWIAIIFFASTGNASMSETSRIIRPLLHFLFPNSPEETLIVYHGWIRKSAHFVEYAILAFWAARAFWSSTIQILQKYWFVFAFLIVLLVASIDEFNQSFNAARTGSIYDVMLDCAGGAFAVFLLYLYKFSARTNG